MNPSNLELITTTALEGRMRDLRTRQYVLRSLHDKLAHNAEELVQAIQKDDGISQAEAQLVVAAALMEVRVHYDALDLDQELEREYRIARGKPCLEQRGPHGIVYVIPDAYTCLFGIVAALSAAFEAGNCGVVELNPTLRHTPQLLQQYFSELNLEDVLAITTERPHADFVEECLVVDQASEESSQHLIRRQEVAHSGALVSIPQRTVAIVDRTGDIGAAAKEIAACTVLFHGQGRYSVDQVLVNEFVAEDFFSILKGELLSAASEKPQAGTRSNRETYSGSRVVLDLQGIKVVEVHDRSSPLLHQRQPAQVLCIHKITSLDDAIDTVNETKKQLGALYLFTGSDEAKYLSQYISTRATFVDHIPPELQIGPAYPIGFPTSITQRYARAMFEIPCPERVSGGKVRQLATVWQHIKGGKASSILSKACGPLKLTGQGKAGAMDFFAQGMLLNLVVCVLPMAALSVVATGKGLAFLYQKFSGH
ncbi:Aldehyde/histidinol dehydrogenase [Aspergillus granulosus]|uniref:Aldehyde/histidinol dehydrogenase n=1 Tax=Aspergillus granulosus TaxID=176169 RepID=A0ABR4H7W1_9EURO